jgi:hypothetical protein
LDVERLWRWRGELIQAVHNRPTGRSASGLQSPGSAPTKKKKKKKKKKKLR